MKLDRMDAELGGEMDDAGSILGIDNIALELPLAGVGSRALAALIDYVLMICFLIGTVMGLAGLANQIGIGESWAIALISVVTFGFQWFYFVLQEMLFKGQTLGKMIVGLRTVGRLGGTPSTGAYLMRNLIRFIDLIVGVPLMASDAQARRFGDRLAGTVVVHDRKEETLIHLNRVPASWGAAEIALVEAFFRRADELLPDRSTFLARRLLKLAEASDPSFVDEMHPMADPIEELATRLQMSRG